MTSNSRSCEAQVTSGSPTVVPDGPSVGQHTGPMDWMVVLASTAGVTVSVAHVYSMGTFILPIEKELGWSRAEISSALTIASVMTVLLAPWVGVLIDRIGSRRIAIAGVAAYPVSLALVSVVGEFLWGWWLAWIMVGVCAVMIKPTVWVAAISGRFDRRRGLALALALCGTGISAAIIPVVTAWFLAQSGWRSAFLMLGVGCAVITLPLVLLFFRDPPHRQTAGAGKPLPGLAAREGLRSSRFLRLAAASLVVYIAIIGVSVHFVPILVSLAIDASTAAMVAAVIGIASICGRIVTGLLLDKFPGQLIGALAFALPIVPCVLLLMFDGSISWAVFIAFLLGFSLGAETDVVAYLAGRYFGLRSFGLLFGTISGLLSLGAGLGPMFAGLIFDQSGSYELLLWAVIPAFSLGGLLLVSLGSYPDFEAPPKTG